MNEAKLNAESVKIQGMKAKIAYCMEQMKKINDLSASPAWKQLNPMEQEFYAAENACWKATARIINIRLKIELGKAARANAQTTPPAIPHPATIAKTANHQNMYKRVR